ncbi:dihydropteroate synthase [Kordia periserrulae]|uniref:Dihydropteroate synthase n=1 Tax=Kordia periserrulae TaxID=701523 RepID=A0A2T6BTN1_9FLAO|nr:dihydropteroate synthase [Kordia periserrulae]PTX59431.1 dihydropteroate synthase [Kordia periserrulae]
MKSINCKGKLIALDTPKVMGILNVTPDSFYDGGMYKDASSILTQVEKMLTDGATFIDVGAYSSRPNAPEVSTKEEKQRLLPILELILTKFPQTILSVDTFRSEVAREAINIGAAIINDISAGNLDANMMQTVGELGVPYSMMHMQGTPKTMQQNPNYENVVNDILKELSEKVALARTHKINDLIVDPGFGFGKTIAHNYTILQLLQLFESLDCPVLVGVSRKSMIYKVLETTPQEALNGTTVLNTIALQNGASILRVHDVKEAVECVKLVEMVGF